MPLSYHIDRSRGLLHLRAYGAVTPEDIAGVADALAVDPDRGAVTTELTDFRETSWDLTPRLKKALEHLDRVCSQHLRLSKRAVVVRGDLQFGLLSQYAQGIAPVGLEVVPFRDEGKARAWLGLDSDGTQARAPEARARGTGMGGVSYMIDGDILTLFAEGERTFTDVRATLNQALLDPALPTGVSLLIDICRSAASPSPQAIIEFAQFLKDLGNVFKGACAVLTCDTVQYGLSMELSGWAGARGVRVRVFRIGEDDKAKAWLSAGAPETAPGGWSIGGRASG
jgi:hypothetical protein